MGGTSSIIRARSSLLKKRMYARRNLRHPNEKEYNHV
jgi:hypothetical protein